MATKEDLAKQVDERLAAKAKAVGQQQAAVSQPTPTQRENDLAKVGALEQDSLEPDGSPPEAASTNPYDAPPST